MFSLVAPYLPRTALSLVWGNPAYIGFFGFFKVKNIHPPHYRCSRGLVVTTHGLQHGFVQSEFHAGLVKHFTLVRVAGYQAIDLHGFGLPDSMATGLGLFRAKRKRFCLLIVFTREKWEV